MIASLVCCVLLVSIGASSNYNYPDSQGYLSDSPNAIKPEKHYLRVKIGTPITLRCHDNGASMEYKPCNSNFQGLLCDSQHQWTRLNVTRGRKHIDAANKNHNGIYKCFDDNSVKKIFIVDVVTPGYTGTRPYVAPLRTSNLTGQINIEFTIQCNVTSEVPPTIFWFKNCYGQKCDIEYNRLCFCHLNSNTSISSYNSGRTYLSKYSIYNARDVDSGVYACLAVTQYGENSQNVTIRVPLHLEEDISFSMLFLIPIALILIPVAIWLCYYRKKKKKPAIALVEQQKQLIRPIPQVNLEINEII